MKKISFLTALLFCGLLIWKSHEQTQPNKSWVAYEKPKETLIKREPLAEEKKYLSSDEETNSAEPVRSPAAHPAPAQLNGRVVFGNAEQDILEGEKDVVAINDPHPDWQSFLAESLLDTQESETKLFLKHLQSVVMVRKDQARFVEEVMVTFQLPNQNISSYMAIVDSETGKMISTWSPTINHNFRTKPPRLSPTGALFSPAAQ